MGKQLHATIEVGATPRRVWQVPTGFAAYPDRNPFITRASGTARPGERPHLRTQPPGGRGVACGPSCWRPTPAGGCAGSASRSGSAASWCPLPLPRLAATPSRTPTAQPGAQTPRRATQHETVPGRLTRWMGTARPQAVSSAPSRNRRLVGAAIGATIPLLPCRWTGRLAGAAAVRSSAGDCLGVATVKFRSRTIELVGHRWIAITVPKLARQPASAHAADWPAAMSVPPWVIASASGRFGI
jgi:hypothetical protein